MEQTKLTKNKIRRLLGRIMVLESKTPRRSPGDFYTSKVENFRKIWITYRNQGQGGFSTTSSILVGCHFRNITARTLRGRGGDCIRDFLTTSSQKFSSKWVATFYHTWSTRTAFKRENTQGTFLVLEGESSLHGLRIFSAASPKTRAHMLIRNLSPPTPHSAIYPSQ